MAEPGHRRAAARRRPAVALAACGVALALVGGFLLSHHHDDTPPSATRDLRGKPVILAPGVVPPAPVVAKMRVNDDVGTRFEVPSVGLDVPLGTLSMVDDNITPPGIDSAYEVRNLGVSPDRAGAGTVFVVMHSLHGGGVGPGNYLIDAARGTTSLARSAAVVVSGVTYKVTGSQAVPLDDLPDRDRVWAAVPNRLVIITCLQTTDGRPATKNLVITAVRA